MLLAAPGIWAGYGADELQKGKRIDVGAFMLSPHRPQDMKVPTVL